MGDPLRERNLSLSAAAAEPSPEPGELQVGLLLDSLTVSAWVRGVVESVRQVPGVRLGPVILNATAEDTAPWLVRALRERRYWLYEAYSRVDSTLLPAHPDAFARVSIADLVSEADVMSVNPRRTRYSDHFEADDANRLAACAPDVLLRFGFRILRGEILTIPTHGIWSYHHGDNLVNRGGPPGFWEVMEDHPVTGVVLQILSEDLDAGRVLCRAWVSTNRNSVRRNRNYLYWRAVEFVPRMLERLRDQGPSVLDADPLPERFRPYGRRLHRKPDNLRFAPLLARHGTRGLRRKVSDRLRQPEWFIAYRPDWRADDPPPEPRRFRRLTPPRDRYWADPFPAVCHGRRALFFEEYLRAEGRGRIAVIELDADGNPGRPRPVLDEETHLSYPFVFEWDGDLYMIPETAERRGLFPYRCTRFPDAWERLDPILSDVPAVDATLRREGDRWWMFVATAPEERSSFNDRLELYMAESPLGPWSPHPCSPVVEDVRGCRPAGRLFRWRGALYRPAQDCSRSYGHAISIKRVERLDAEGYAEREVWRIGPDWAPKLRGTHTLNVTDGLVTIDGLRKPLAWQRGRS